MKDRRVQVLRSFDVAKKIDWHPLPGTLPSLPSLSVVARSTAAACETALTSAAAFAIVAVITATTADSTSAFAFVTGIAPGSAVSELPEGKQKVSCRTSVGVTSCAVCEFSSSALATAELATAATAGKEAAMAEEARMLVHATAGLVVAAEDDLTTALSFATVARKAAGFAMESLDWVCLEI